MRTEMSIKIVLPDVANPTAGATDNSDYGSNRLERHYGRDQFHALALCRPATSSPTGARPERQQYCCGRLIGPMCNRAIINLRANVTTPSGSTSR